MKLKLRLAIWLRNRLKRIEWADKAIAKSVAKSGKPVRLSALEPYYDCDTDGDPFDDYIISDYDGDGH